MKNTLLAVIAITLVLSTGCNNDKPKEPQVVMVNNVATPYKVKRIKFGGLEEGCLVTYDDIFCPDPTLASGDDDNITRVTLDGKRYKLVEEGE